MSCWTSQSFAVVTFTSSTANNAGGGAALNGFVTNDIKITFTGQYTGAQALINLFSGSLYQDAIGSATAPSPAVVGVFPSLAFDTFVAQGSPTSGGAYGDPSVGGGAVDLGGPASAAFTTTGINQAWNPAGGVTITDQVNFLIGRFTLSSNANGTARFLASAAGTPVSIDYPISNGVFRAGDPSPIVGDIGPGTPGFDVVANILGEVIKIQPVDTAPGIPPVTWSIGAPTYTPGFGALPGAPGLGLATYSINPTTGAFQFNTLGSSGGTYVFLGTAGNALGTDQFSITVEVIVPEPATFAMLGLALVGFVGSVRYRKFRTCQQFN